jgi:histidyl-tRNA synthetase
MSIPIPPGTFDILPVSREPWRNSHLWNYVEETIRTVARDYGYQEIRTPLFERTELFQRGVGETSDIVSKEMYTFTDKGGRSLSLRPEGTAPAIRAFIENRLDQEMPSPKLFYICPMFRYERSQAGRYRQHHQFGVEAIGNNSPEQDVEVIDMLWTLYQRLGLKNLQLCINSIGEIPARIAYRTALQEYLKQFFDQLSNDSQNRFTTNPMRILDSKDPNDQKILANAPSIFDFLSPECSHHFQTVQKLLQQLKIPFTVTPRLVRGLDYYNRTVFEVVAGDLGAQNSIGGGGRYDGLIKQLGGPDLPAMGFGTGIERIIQTLLKQELHLPPVARPMLFLIALGDEAKKACFSLLHQLRQNGIAAQMDFSGRKLNKVMQTANDLQPKYVAVVGENELAAQEVDLKDMSNGTTIKAPISSLARLLHLETRSVDFMQLWQEMAKPFKNPQEAQFFINKVNQSISTTQKIAQDLQNVAEEMKGLFGE